MSLSSAIGAGEYYLLTHMWDTCRIPVYRAKAADSMIEGILIEDSTDFGTAYFLEMARWSHSPQIRSTALVAANNILSHELALGVWNYYPSSPLYTSDVDCIGLEAYELYVWLGYKPDNWDTLQTVKVSSGCYLTWLRGDGYNDSDAVVNASLARWLSLWGGDISQTAWLHSLLGQQIDSVMPYYHSDLAFYYIYTRFLRDANTPVTKKDYTTIVNTVISMYPWGSSLNVALALNTLLNIGYTGIYKQMAIDALLSQQNMDGSWPAFVYYTGPWGGMSFGSKELTTVIVLEALYRCSDNATMGKVDGAENCTSKKSLLTGAWDMLGRKVVEKESPFYSSSGTHLVLH